MDRSLSVRPSLFCSPLITFALLSRSLLCVLGKLSWTVTGQNVPDIPASSHTGLAALCGATVCDLWTKVSFFFTLCMHVPRFFFHYWGALSVIVWVLNIPNVAKAKTLPKSFWACFFSLYKSVGGVYCSRASMFRCQWSITVTYSKLKT